MTVTTTARVDWTGLIYIYTSADDLTNVLSVVAPPTFYGTDGAALAVNGPFWSDVSHNNPWLCYQPQVPLSADDVVTMTTTDGWATTTAGTLSGVTAQNVPNYVGRDEPSPGTYGGLPVPGSDQPRSERKLRVGYNATWGARASYFASWFPFANRLKCAGRGSKSIATMDASGHPLTLSSTLSLAFLQPNAAGSPDGRGIPLLTGTFRFFARERRPSGPMTVWLSNTTNFIVTGPTKTTGPDGTTMWAWEIQYVANPTRFASNITLNISGTGPNGSGDYTLSNESFQTPGNPIQDASPYAPDANFVRRVTTPGGKTPDWFRWVDAMIGIDGISTQIDDSDRMDPTQFSWSDTVGITLNITQVSAFDTTRWPYTFWSQPWKNATQPGGGPPGAPYALPTNPGLENFSGPATGWIMVAFTYDNSAYQLKSWQTIWLKSGFGSLPCTNGSNPNVAVNLNNATPTVFMTSPNTGFFTWWGLGATLTSTAGLPGAINTIVGDNAINGTAAITVPDGGSLGHGPTSYVTGKLGSNYWMPVPAGATDDYVRGAIAEVLPNGQPGQKILPELGNENWSLTGDMLGMFLLGSCKALSSTFTTRASTAAIRQKQVHDICQAAASAVGRGGDIVRSFGSQYGNPGETAAIVSTANAWNAANPDDPMPIDAVHVAPYVPAWTVVDSTMAKACASVYGWHPDSKEYGNPFPFTRAQWWSLWGAHARLNTLTNGPKGVMARHVAELKKYIPVASQPAGFVPELIGYEAGLQMAYPAGVSASPAMLNQLAYDLVNDPAVKQFDETLYRTWQFGGFDSITILSLSMIPVGSNYWAQYWWEGQEAGPGDGSDGLPPNQFYADTKQSQYGNRSPRGAAWKEWADDANDPPNVTPLSWSPSTARDDWYRRLCRGRAGTSQRVPFAQRTVNVTFTHDEATNTWSFAGGPF